MTIAAASFRTAPNRRSLRSRKCHGSRIRTSPLERDQPVVQIDQEQIAKTGLTSTVDVLQRIPSAAGGLNGKFNNSGNLGNPPDGGGVGAGAAEIDLRYLGSRRVLVLVDGLHWVSGTSASGVPGAVDLNTIPTGMISRMEVLQQGASPIYGSDAIAGVVNIITKQRQDGFEATAQIGQFGEGDGLAQDYNLSWGASQEHLSLVFGVGYFKQDPVYANDRDISRFPNPYATSCTEGGCSSGTPNARVIVHDPNTNQDMDITLRNALQPGQRPIYIPGNPTSPLGSYKDFTTADRFNFQPYNYIMTPLERISLFGSVVQDITDNVRFRARGSYVQRKSANQAAPLPLFVGPDAGNGNLLDTVAIDASNPYNPFGFTLQPGTYSFVGGWWRTGRGTTSRPSTPKRHRHAQRRRRCHGASVALGLRRHLVAQPRRTDLHRQHQCPARPAGARPDLRLHRLLRAVQYLRRPGHDHRGDAELHRLHPEGHV